MISSVVWMLVKKKCLVSFVKVFFDMREALHEKLKVINLYWYASFQVAEVIDQPGEDLLSTAAVLRYCKFRILRPYTRLLAAMGLRPLTLEPNESRCIGILGHLHLIQALAFMCMGYMLQYMSCFR